MFYAILFIVLLIILIVASVVFTVRLVKSIGDKKQIIRGVLILTILSLSGYLGVTCYNNTQQTESFRQGVELLKSNKYINEKIGYFDSYSYFNSNMPNENDNPAILKVSLKGEKAELFVTCQIKRGKDEVWYLTEIKQDSIQLTR